MKYQQIQATYRVLINKKRNFHHYTYSSVNSALLRINEACLFISTIIALENSYGVRTFFSLEFGLD